MKLTDTDRKKPAMRDQIKTGWQLFTVMLTLSAATFGGGYVIVSLMKKRFCEQLKLIDEREMYDLAAVAQTAPGSIVVNAAILVGYRIMGIPGALCCVAGAVLPPLFIICTVFVFYQAIKDHAVMLALMRGMRAAAAAVILDIALSMQKNVVGGKQVLLICAMAAAFILSFFLKVNIAFLMLGGILAGLLNGCIKRRRRQ